MRKVSAILQSKTCDCKVACAPCYAPERCADNEFFASAVETSPIISLLGGLGYFRNTIASATSCVSYNDALNKATYAAMLGWSSNPGTVNFSNWTPIRSNEEISYTSYCPCGWIGDPVTVTIPAGSYTDYWTIAEANLQAYNQADDDSEDLLDCDPPA